MRNVASMLLAITLAGGLVLPAVGACGTAGKLRKMETREQDHYAALRVWMTEDQQKAWFKLKTPEARDAYLKEQGLWDKFYKYDEATRARILSADVQPGWRQDQVFMAWGEPAERTRIAGGRNAELSERLTYRFEVDKNGDAYLWIPGSNQTYKAVSMYRMSLVVDDSVVAEMEKKNGWTDN